MADGKYREHAVYPHSGINSVRLGLAIVPQHSVDGRYTSTAPQEPARNTRPNEFHRIHRRA